MNQGASQDITLSMLLSRLNIKAGPKDLFPDAREQLAEDDHRTWKMFKVYGG